MLLPSIFSLLLLLLLSLLRGHYFLLPVSVVVSDLAAAVLLLCYPVASPRNTPPAIRFSDITFLSPNSRLLFRRSYSLVSLFIKNCEFIKIMAFSAREGGEWKLTALPRPVSPAPPTSPVPSPGYCTRLAGPLL